MAHRITIPTEPKKKSLADHLRGAKFDMEFFGRATRGKTYLTPSLHAELSGYDYAVIRAEAKKADRILGMHSMQAIRDEFKITDVGTS